MGEVVIQPETCGGVGGLAHDRGREALPEGGDAVARSEDVEGSEHRLLERLDLYSTVVKSKSPLNEVKVWFEAHYFVWSKG